MDNQLVRELFSNTISAAEVLGTDHELVAELKAKRAKLAPTSIGKFGQIIEWNEDYPEVDIHHRHVSQLYGLYPGNELSYEKTPELMKAAKVTLERRGDQSTGWSMAWKISFWARLKDGNHSYKLIHELLKPAGKSWGTYPNLFSACPPLQIDGAFGGSAGVAEMLVQSQSGAIEFLPALPDSWKEGHFEGLKVRGGGEVSAIWSNGELSSFSIKASVPTEFVINMPTHWDKKTIKATTKSLEIRDNKIYIKLSKNQQLKIEK